MNVLATPKESNAISPSTSVIRRLFYEGTAVPAPEVYPNHPTIVALAQAPFLADRTDDASFLICAEQFFEDNPLIAATLKPQTQHKYAVALENFRNASFGPLPSGLPLDHRLAIYVQEAFTVNPKPGNRQEMANLVCMLLLMYPSLRTNLGLTRKCLAGWRVLRPAKSSAPFTRDIVFALGWRLMSLGQPGAAVAVIISYCACLRISEALSLQIQDLAFPCDARIVSYGPIVAGMNIRDAKTARHTGELQFVKIEDVEAIKLLQAWMSSTHRNRGPLFSISYQKYASVLKASLASLGINHVPFTPHSARIGKATEDYIRGVPVEQIAINGRWRAINSLSYYVNNGRAWLLDTQISQVKQRNIFHDAANMSALIQSSPISPPPGSAIPPQ